MQSNFYQTMSLFKPKLPVVEKQTAQHPWASQIKDVYSSKIKYAHNSVRNPIYPMKKQQKKKVYVGDRTKFTVIGDRVTKEFNYCANLVKGLHKYRKDRFIAPDIRGVTTVEWPLVLNELRIRFGEPAFCLSSSVAVLFNNKFLGGEKELKELVETNYTYHLCLDYYKEGVAEFAKFVNGSGRSCAYMNIAIDGEHVGTLMFMLYSDIVPRTCENFLRLCKETKGGYSGTPIHRIVKDGWIQGGGFGLKSTCLDCESFVVQHDRRGVLCMANDGRHIDCSTQFFVLLQPAPWMASKYVAFGQLIEGKRTLERIEAVPTWYEEPTSQVTIYQAGVFNMDCPGITISKGTNEYIQGHIEDLNALGELLMRVLLEKVFLTAELREIERLKELDGEEVEYDCDDDGVGSVRETQRFNRRKEDIEKQLQSSNDPRQARLSSVNQRPQTASVDNKEFDVESYDPEYEIEETDYVHQSLHTPSVVVKKEIPFYMSLTDNPYPGEKSSEYDLRRFLQGDYCFEGDLETEVKNYVPNKKKASYPSVMFDFEESDSETDEEEELDSDDEKEIQKYLRLHSDQVSFGGSIIKRMAKGFGKFDIRTVTRKSQLLTDEQLRKLRIATVDNKVHERRDKKVSISHSLPCDKEHHSRIKRRQTGFMRPEDLEKIHIFRKHSTDLDDDDDDDDDVDDDNDGDDISGNRKVRIADTATPTGHGVASGRRATGYVRPSDINVDSDDSDSEVRQSVLIRLFDDLKADEDAPTLKDYKPTTESNQQNLLLKFSSNYRIKSDESTREKYLRHSLTMEHSYDRVLSLQHGKKVTRKISSDYVKTIGQMEHKTENSIRSVEFAKTRPAMSVAEYQLRNKRYQDAQRNSQETKTEKLDEPLRGLRLPGDSPLYSTVEIMDENMDF